MIIFVIRLLELQRIKIGVFTISQKQTFFRVLRFRWTG